MHLSQINQEIKWKSLTLAVLSLLPIFIGFIEFHEPLLFNVGLITISLFVPIERNHSGLYLTVLQFILIGACFTLLFFTFDQPALFVLLCAAMAFGSIFSTRYHAKLRTLANFIFIPAVYLACELHEKLPQVPLAQVYTQFICLMPIALFTIIILVVAVELLAQYKLNHSLKFKPLAGRILQGKVQGKGELNWLIPAITIFFGILIAASLVVYRHIPHGEWMIWSTAAVITVNVGSSNRKIQDRLIGLVIGAPLGFFVGHFLPKTTLTYSLAVLAIMLTLVAFNTYRLAFGARCFFVVLASYIATAAPQIALERVENVITGGLIGIASLYIVHGMSGYFSKKTPRPL